MVLTQVQMTISGKQNMLYSLTESIPQKAMESIEKLLAGNHRWLSGQVSLKLFDNDRQKTLLKGQHPYCTIIYCSDSRIPIEIVADANPGEIFGIRNAGNTVKTSQDLGSVEYAVSHLNVPLVVVLAHTQCGAVTAACSGAAQGHISEIVKDISPCVIAAREKDPDSQDILIQHTIEENAKQAIRDMYANSSIIRNAVDKGDVLLTCALYNLKTGHIIFDF